jgi:pyruvate,water dikinase
MRIAKLAKALEVHFGGPQDMEWVISAEFPSPNNIFLLQTRPAAGIKAKAPPSSTARIIDDVIRKIHNL